MFRKSAAFLIALTLGAVLSPAAALADDPHDLSMRSAGARARDRAIIRRMNEDQLAYVRRRDAKSMESYHKAQNESGTRYADARADYGQKMAAWRRAVAACKAGHWEYCDN